MKGGVDRGEGERDFVRLAIRAIGERERLDIDSIECSSTLTSNCLTAAQIAVVRKIWNGPVDSEGQHLYPGGYSLGSEFNWSNGTSANLPLTAGGTVMPASFITAWLQYFAFGTYEAGTNIYQNGQTPEPFTRSYFEQIEKLAPDWDATNPDLRPFERAGGKLILWQGEADWSIPTITSISYYQAVVKAMGGLWNTQQCSWRRSTRPPPVDPAAGRAADPAVARPAI